MRQISAVTLSVFLTCGAAQAQGLKAVRPLPGYVCMQLAITPDQSLDPKVGVPILNAPSRSGSIVNYAASVVLVRDPPKSLGGFLQVLRFNGQEGWIEGRYLRPWSNPYAPAARCVPSVMSDGSPGFGS